MFTGIIRTIGRVLECGKTPQGMRLTISTADPFGLGVGESVSVNGCCLTLVGGGNPLQLSFDVVPETLRCTTLGHLKIGEPVNLEPPLAAGGPLSGHIVQGHIDGIGMATRLGDRAAGDVIVRTVAPADLMECITPKGSIAVDGVSLTIAQVGADWFDVALIPETLQRTTLARIGVEAVRVNLEVDFIVKAVMWRRRAEVSRR